MLELFGLTTEAACTANTLMWSFFTFVVGLSIGLAVSTGTQNRQPQDSSDRFSRWR